MRISFFGGFGEKGRTSLGLAYGGTSIVLDVGINTGVGVDDRAYRPAIEPEALARLDAILVSHAHEDHIGALGWCFANGFRGRVFMTEQTLVEMDAVLAAYDPRHQASVDRAAIHLIEVGAPLRIGAMTVETGRSGHTVGGLWLRVSAGEGADARSVLYCADVVPQSDVLAMDPLPRADALIVDASYGLDDVQPAERVAAIAAWVDAHPGASLLPTPLTGKPLEILMALSGPVAIHHAMRAPILQQLAQAGWLKQGINTLLQERLNTARDWHEGEAFPLMPLLVHDGMGITGPARDAIPRAEAENVPVLLTGHLPKGSPAAALQGAGRADWIRVPTHPVLSENGRLIAAVDPGLVLGHSCDLETARALQTVWPDFRPVSTGAEIQL